MRNPFRRQDRGVAMLLVLISLMMATILTMSYVASRDNSTAIGDNIANSAAARWAADSGLDMGLAILQTQSNWRTTQVGGKMVSGYALAGGTVDLDVMDRQTGFPPTDKSEYIRLTSTAVVNGLKQQTVADAYAPLNPGTTVDVDLSEFAVFAGNSLDMENQSIITRWPMSPLSSIGRRLLIGTKSTNASSIILGGTAAAIDTTVIVPPAASNSLISNSASPPVKKTALLDPIPLPAPPSSGVTAPLISPNPDLTMNGGTALVVANSHYRNVELKNNAVRTIKGNITTIADQDYKINTGSKLVIDGAVKMVIFGGLILDTGSIELKPGAKLVVFTRGASGGQPVEIKDGYIGDVRSNNVRDNSGKASWMDPTRILLYSSAPSGAAGEWRMEANSVVKGNIYAPQASQVTLRDTSALYGRVAARVVQMRDNAALFYDPTLNSRTGYSNPKSMIFNASGHVQPAVASVATLDVSSLQNVANSLAVTVASVIDGITSLIAPASPSSSTPPAVGPGDPTPRPIPVEYQLVSYGMPVSSWEH